MATTPLEGERANIDDFNVFLDSIDAIVARRSVSTTHQNVTYKINLLGARWTGPEKTAMECLALQEGYEGRIHISFAYVTQREGEEAQEVERGESMLTSLPILVRSKACVGGLPPAYRGGHFIAPGGMEKILQMQLLLGCNDWKVFAENRCEIRSSVAEGGRIATVSLTEHKGQVWIVVPYANEAGDSEMRWPLETMVAALEHDEAARRVLRPTTSATRLLRNSILPHCNSNTQKVVVLRTGERILRECNAGTRPLDSRDDASHKRVDCAGALMGQMLRMLLRTHLRQVRQQLKLSIQANATCMDAGNLLAGRCDAQLFASAFRKGVWGTKHSTEVS